MSSFAVPCGKCGARVEVRAEIAGTKVRCPHCREVFVVPPPEGIAAAPQAVSGTPPARQQSCPSCQKALPPRAKVCVNCGFDLRTGRKLQTVIVQGTGPGPSSPNPPSHAPQEGRSAPCLAPKRPRKRARSESMTRLLYAALILLSLAGIFVPLGVMVTKMAPHLGSLVGWQLESWRTDPAAFVANLQLPRRHRATLTLEQPESFGVLTTGERITWTAKFVECSADGHLKFDLPPLPKEPISVPTAVSFDVLMQCALAEIPKWKAVRAGEAVKFTGLFKEVQVDISRYEANGAMGIGVRRFQLDRGKGGMDVSPSPDTLVTYTCIFDDVKLTEPANSPPVDPAIESQVQALKVALRAADGPLPDDKVDRELLLDILRSPSADAPPTIKALAGGGGSDDAKYRVGAARLLGKPDPKGRANLPILVGVVATDADHDVVAAAAAAANQIVGADTGQTVALIGDRFHRVSADVRSRLPQLSLDAIAQASEVQCPFPPNVQPAVLEALRCAGSAQADALITHLTDAALDAPVSLVAPYGRYFGDSDPKKRYAESLPLSSAVTGILNQVGLMCDWETSRRKWKLAETQWWADTGRAVAPSIRQQKCRTALDTILQRAKLTWHVNKGVVLVGRQ